jgi:hypothetical protein
MNEFQMTNKELLDKLQAFLLTQDPNVVSRCFANHLLDMYRINNFSDLPQTEKDSLIKRIQLNASTLADFAANGPKGTLKQHVEHSDRHE